MGATIKKGDTARALTATLTLNGSAIDLTGATVVLVWKLNGTVSRKSATIEDATAGSVSYTLQSADVATAGTVKLEWEVTFSDATVLTVPSESYETLVIEADLG